MKSNEPMYGSLNKTNKGNDSGLVYSNIMHGSNKGRNGIGSKIEPRSPYSNMSAYEGNLQGLISSVNNCFITIF